MKEWKVNLFFIICIDRRICISACLCTPRARIISLDSFNAFSLFILWCIPSFAHIPLNLQCYGTNVRMFDSIFIISRGHFQLTNTHTDQIPIQKSTPKQMERLQKLQRKQRVKTTTKANPIPEHQFDYLELNWMMTFLLTNSRWWNPMPRKIKTPGKFGHIWFHSLFEAGFVHDVHVLACGVFLSYFYVILNLLVIRFVSFSRNLLFNITRSYAT